MQAIYQEALNAVCGEFDGCRISPVDSEAAITKCATSGITNLAWPNMPSHAANIRFDDFEYDETSHNIASWYVGPCTGWPFMSLVSVGYTGGGQRESPLQERMEQVRESFLRHLRPLLTPKLILEQAIEDVRTSMDHCFLVSELGFTSPQSHLTLPDGKVVVRYEAKIKILGLEYQTVPACSSRYNVGHEPAALELVHVGYSASIVVIEPIMDRIIQKLAERIKQKTESIVTFGYCKGAAVPAKTEEGWEEHPYSSGGYRVVKEGITVMKE